MFIQPLPSYSDGLNLPEGSEKLHTANLMKGLRKVNCSQRMKP
ncbi:hypothetical protein Cst_c23940 [Thermoclostridium stercorarium subsp. stercorarium DSM 8532]|uniref:Uncharacterized protein n=1 Tax=Thermoclostridium stercorarium (strain ATCC 35414 / DSM 8532 / NCIMB 11754) TaxID=1121335 RepID=L7VRT0_THES1|nr:hypothetical protein Cst_c23940 [Thermoclostridium stercorarium subsp. stercorarium DSM 8532]